MNKKQITEWNNSILQVFAGELFELTEFTDVHKRLKFYNGSLLDYWPSTSRGMWLITPNRYTSKKPFNIFCLDAFFEMIKKKK